MSPSIHHRDRLPIPLLPLHATEHTRYHPGLPEKSQDGRDRVISWTRRGHFKKKKKSSQHLWKHNGPFSRKRIIFLGSWTKQCHGPHGDGHRTPVLDEENTGAVAPDRRASPGDPAAACPGRVRLGSSASPNLPLT